MAIIGGHFGTIILSTNSSAVCSSPSVTTAITLAPLALHSSAFPIVLSLPGISFSNAITGVFFSSRAIGPCFNSEA